MVVCTDFLIALKGRLKAMTAAQMDFLGLKEFKFDEKTQEVRLILQVDNVGDLPMQIQLKNFKLDSAKVGRSNQSLIIGRIQRSTSN
jgi:hypothetical protein